MSVCQCDGLNDAPRPFALAPFEEDDTMGRFQTFMRCYRKVDRKLKRWCRENRRLLAKRGQKILERCVDARQTKKEKENVQPFAYKPKNCNAMYNDVLADPSYIAWVCQCNASKLYNVGQGVSLFNLDVSHLDVVEELKQMKKCNLESVENLSNVCKNSPGDFETLSRHVMQACCKRVRSGSNNSKFQCVEAVLEPVNDLKGMMERYVHKNLDTAEKVFEYIRTG
ncbi:hypothetical protein FGB62_262g02 [Gracilaria domingensis]|nr:hypothetical protein FGB62_262g02 [Gracilaria domingensis]